MKKLVICILVLAAPLCFAISCFAAVDESFDDEVRQIEDSIDDDTSQELRGIGISGVDDVITKGLDNAAIGQYLIDLLSENSRGPLAGLTLMTAALLLVSVGESYTASLRYTDTKDIMGVVVSLYLASAAVMPVTELATSAAVVIQGAASVMTIYLPVMAGILVFSGHAIASGGYYAAVVTAAQLLSRLSSTVLSPLLKAFLSLSVCAGISSRIRLNGMIEMIAKGFKYGVTFAMSIFIAIIGMNGALSGAADSVANKAAKFTLSSFIPLIGSSVAEAYSSLQSSVGIMRSGIGVFVILAVIVAFVPLLIRSVLWSFALVAAQMVGEALSVTSAGAILNALSQFLSALRALLIAVMTVFLISSAVMMKIGGAS